MERAPEGCWEWKEKSNLGPSSSETQEASPMAPSPCPGARPLQLLGTRFTTRWQADTAGGLGPARPLSPRKPVPKRPARQEHSVLAQPVLLGSRSQGYTGAWAGLHLAAHSMDPVLWKDWLGRCLFVFVPFRLTKPAYSGHKTDTEALMNSPQTHATSIY